MARRFLLVGLFIVWPFQQGQMMQLGFATLVAMAYLMIQTQAAPYRSPLDNALALGCSFSLCILLICCVFYKWTSLTELEEFQARMSIEQRGDYGLASIALTCFFIVCTFGALVVTTLLLAAGLGREVLRTPRRLLYLQGSEEVPPPLTFVRNDERLMDMLYRGNIYRRDPAGCIVLPEFPPGAGPFHVFLSHNWKHGQEKMRIVKSELREMVPGISVFLECAANI